jgi:hypothetical protein
MELVCELPDAEQIAEGLTPELVGEFSEMSASKGASRAFFAELDSPSLSESESFEGPGVCSGVLGVECRLLLEVEGCDWS